MPSFGTAIPLASFEYDLASPDFIRVK